MLLDLHFKIQIKTRKVTFVNSVVHYISKVKLLNNFRLILVLRVFELSRIKTCYCFMQRFSSLLNFGLTN